MYPLDFCFWRNNSIVSAGTGCRCIDLACLKVGHMGMRFPLTPASSRSCWTYILADDCAAPGILLMWPANEFRHWYSLSSMASASNLIITPGVNHARLIFCEAILFPRWWVSRFHYYFDLRNILAFDSIVQDCYTSRQHDSAAKKSSDTGRITEECV